MAKAAGPGDVFRHLLAIIALYIAAVSFGALLFGYIERWFPDPLADFPRAAAGSLRWAIASLVVVFPVYVWFSWLLARDVERHPEKRGLKTRKWLYHFTMFAAAIVIIGDLVAVIYNFLGGGLSSRFLLKVAAVLFIAVAVFPHSLWNLRREEMASRDPRMRLFVWGVVAVVGLATVGGFFLDASPLRERLRSFAERRVSDLQTIQWQVVSFWQRKDRLPASLDELRDDISGFIPPRDAESGAAYEYRSLGALQFELCAAFKTESAAASMGYEGAPRPIAPAIVPGSGIPDSWAHQAGRVCFERTIDPELYRIEKPPPR